MKLVTFVRSGQARLGLLHGDMVVDALAAANGRAMFSSTLAFIKSGGDGHKAAASRCAMCR
jgi:hypothetical protein